MRRIDVQPSLIGSRATLNNGDTGTIVEILPGACIVVQLDEPQQIGPVTLDRVSAHHGAVALS